MRPRVPATHVLFTILMAAAVPQAAMGQPAPPAALLPAIVAQLDARAADALPGIAGEGGKLLAVRGWLRAGSELAGRWSWSAAQIEAWPHSPEHAAVMADVDAVAAQFGRANPGYELHVNREVRSLELQIERWNSNASVRAAAAALQAAVQAEAARWHDVDESTRAARLAAFLRGWFPPRPVTLASPGLSAHGQSRAFDFQVLRAGRIVAGTNAADARLQWDAPGWTARLAAAVSAAGNRFEGPLKSPYEPWHYIHLQKK